MALSTRRRLQLQVLLFVAFGLGFAILLLAWREDVPESAQDEDASRADVQARANATLRAAGRPPPTEPSGTPGPTTARKPDGRDGLPVHGTGPTGSARVRVTDATGAAVDFEGRIYLFWRPRGSDMVWGRQGRPAAPVVDGVARFPTVPLGKDLKFRSAGGTRWFSAEVIVDGPGQPGEEVEAHLRLGPEKPLVSAIAIDEEGKALADLQLSVGFTLIDEDAPPGSPPDRRPVNMLWNETDDAGRFTARVALRAPPGKVPVLFVELDELDRGAGQVIRRAVVPLDAGLPGGAETDLGEVRLEPTATERLLVQGVVVDEDGGPIANAWITAGYHLEPRRGWQSLHRGHVRSDSRGHFTIRTTREVPPAYKVSASVHGRVGDTVEVARGTRDVVLRLVRGGGLYASFEIPEGIPPTRLEGVIRRQGESDGGAPNQAMGRFGYDALRPGRYDVIVRIKSTTWELARVSGVVVRRGERADDARLRNIDVQGRCRLLLMSVLRPDGAPLARDQVSVRDRQGRGGSVRTDRRGRAAMVVPSRVDRFVVRRGSLGAEVPWGRDRQVVRLTPR